MPTLRFLPSGRAIRVAPGTRLIDAIRSAGLPIASSCGTERVCGRCGVRAWGGELCAPSALERRSKQRNGVPDELRLACAVRVHDDDLEVHAPYWGPLERDPG